MGSQQHLHKLLAAAGGPLAQLLHASQEHARLLAQLRQRLPADLAAARRSAPQAPGHLRLGVSGSAWATRLRFMAPQLCRQLADWPYGPVEAVQVHVAAPTGAAPSGAPPAPVPLSSASREHLETVARTTTDPRLAAALRALAGSSERPGGSAEV
jgi:hypothetical protein